MSNTYLVPTYLGPTYFDRLPEELIPEVLKYLKYKDTFNFEDIIPFDKYELLFSYSNLTIYNKIKFIFTVDKHMKKYQNSWRILYKNLDFMIEVNIPLKIDEYRNIYKCDPIVYDIFYSILLLEKYPKVYHYKYKNIEDSIPWFPILLYNTFKDAKRNETIKSFISLGLLKDKIDYMDLHSDFLITPLSIVILSYILLGDTNFVMENIQIDDLLNIHDSGGDSLSSEIYEFFGQYYRSIIDMLRDKLK